MSNTTVGSLKQYYVKKGGKLSDVENISTIPGMIDAITALPGGGGGASSLSDLTDTAISDPEVGDVLAWDGSKWGNAKNNPYFGKNVVHMGDSWVQSYNIAELAAEKVGYNVTNCGLQSTCITDKGNLLANSSYFSLIRLAKAIRDNDWTDQDAHMNERWNPQYTNLKDVDWSEVDVLILSYGTNDWLANAIPGDAYARDDKSICGALKTTIGIFAAINPNMEIIVTTPCYIPVYKNDTVIPAFVDKKAIYADIRNAIATAASKCGVKVIDEWALSGINEYNSSITMIPNDIHPTPAGQEKWATAFANAMINGYCGCVVLDTGIHYKLKNHTENLAMDDIIFSTHPATNASFVHQGHKYICTARDEQYSECVFYCSPNPTTIQSGTKLHVDAWCASTTADKHRLGVRLYDPANDVDVLDQYVEFSGSWTKQLNYTTSQDYTDVRVIFYIKNMTDFATSQALAFDVNCTITEPT